MSATRNAGAAAQTAAPAAQVQTPAPATVTTPAPAQTSTPPDPEAAPAPVQPDPPDEQAPPDVVGHEPARRTYLSNIELRGMHDNGKPWPAPGEPVDLPEQIAADYLAAGYIVELPEHEAAGDVDAESRTPKPAGRRSVRAST